MKGMLGIWLAVFLIFGFSSCSQHAGSTKKPGVIPKVDYKEAPKYMYKKATVCGKVADRKDLSGFGLTVLGLGVPQQQPGAVGIEIKTGDVGKFPSDLYVGLDVCITGKIKRNPVGGAAISLSDPSQVSGPDGKPLNAKEKEPYVPEISYDEAVLYVWTNAKVCGPVVDQMSQGGTTTLGMGVSINEGASSVGIEIADADKGKFPGDLYIGKEICVSGRVIQNQAGGASIRLTEPAQVSMK